MLTNGMIYRIRNVFVPLVCKPNERGNLASQITGVSIVCPVVCSDADYRKHQSSASLALVRGIHRSAGNQQVTGRSPHKGPITRKSFHLVTALCFLIFRIQGHACQWHKAHLVDKSVSRVIATDPPRIGVLCYGHKMDFWQYQYRQASNIRRTKSQNVIVCSLVLPLSLLNPLKPCDKRSMKMKSKHRLLALLALYFSDQKFYCLLRCE